MTDIATTKKKGGIQPGTVASSVESKLIDKQVKTANQELFQELKETIPGLTFQLKLRKEQIPGEIGACAPDGGIWFYNGVPIFASEAKKQGKRGNAIDRWYKNPNIMKGCNKDILYVTFCTGEGTLEKGPIRETLHYVVEGDYNIIREKSKSYGWDNFSIFLEEKNFDYDFVKTTLKEIILKAINKVK